ncbi:hypothetical protein GS910_26025 [Paraburkholderia sp. RL16-012-BIC-B]|nr:hypothetical protein [Paraburkholderia madseniana]
MSCAARYSETTSLEFILNPFKFFFTNYVAKIAPYPPPNIPHLETQIRSPTIFRSHHSECAAIAGPRCCLSSAICSPYCSAWLVMLRYTNRLVHRTISLLYRTACLHAHTFLH